MPEGVDDEERRDNRAGSGVLANSRQRLRGVDFWVRFSGHRARTQLWEAQRREWATYLPRGTLAVLS
jgi:hypothetical protein